MTSISFFNNNVTGTLPSTLGRLSELVAFDASYNKISGPIPNSYASLTNLQSFEMSGNQLHGPVDDSLFSQLKKLRILELNQNNLTGSLPPLTNCTKLESIELKENHFEGKLPEAWSQLPVLTTITVNGNYLTGKLPESWSNITNLVYLETYDNLLSGSLPAAYEELQKIQRVRIYQNRFTGSIPAAWCNMSSLEYFELYGNQLNGSIPNCLCGLKKLSRFSAQVNDLTGPIPHDFGQWKKLDLFEASLNKISGPMPASIGYAISLQYLDLEGNLISSSLPPSLVLLGNLTSFTVKSNLMNGTFPSNLKTLESLTEIILDNNQFSGTIPEEIRFLSALSSLSLAFNRFNGRIPRAVGMIPNLEELTLSGNQLTGSLPDELYWAQTLQYFGAGQNGLNGTLSEAIGNMTSLEQFYILFTDLTGSIPAALGQLSSLISLGLSGNRLDGTIPSELFRVNSTIQDLYFGGNSLHGSIPRTIVNCHQLNQLQLKGNLVTGTLEDIDFSVFQQLFTFEVSENMLHGTIPSSFWTLPLIRVVLLTDNAFSGSIGVDDSDPRAEYAFETIADLIVGGNQFTGPILNGRLTTQNRIMKYFNVSHNYFTGPLDASISNWRQTVGFGMGNNFFTGPIVNRFQEMTELIVLTLSSNMLTGPLTSMINTTGSYVSVAVDNNAFTGSLPSDVLARGNLASFVASLNCLTGTLPAEALCANQIMNELLLDGLHSSAQCDSQQKVLFGWSKARIAVEEQVTGAFPTCLLTSLPKLVTLHLSGNSLTGRNLQSIDRVTPLLADIDVSHNLLSGSVSQAIWQHNFSQQLDLSFNQLTGVIDDSISSIYSDPRVNTSLSLQVNRLSGSIPSALEYAVDINILEGNMFSCNANGLYFSASTTNLPENDPNLNTYECGSDATNSALLAVVVLGMFLGVYWCWLMLLWGKSHVDSRRLPDWSIRRRWQHFVLLSRVKLHFWWTSFSDPVLVRQIPAIRRAHLSLVALLAYLRIITVFVLVGAIPLYMLLSEFYGTYTYQYVWALSLTFMRGITPTVILAVFLLVVLASILAMVQFYREAAGEPVIALYACQFLFGGTGSIAQNETTPPGGNEDVENHPIRRPTITEATLSIYHQQTLFSYAFNVLFALADIAIVVTVNAVYVYALGDGVGVNALFFVSLTISLFKVGWNAVVLNEIVAKNSRQWVLDMWSISQSCLRTCTGRRPPPPEGDQPLPTPLEPPSATTPAGTASSEGPLLGLSTTIHLLLSIFNNVVAPYLAEAFISANCFKYALTQAPAISAVSQGTACYLTYYSFVNSDFQGVLSSGITGHLTCAPRSSIPANETVGLTFARVTSISYNPAYTYSFQCSSSLLTSFITVFVLRYIISGLVLPLLMVTLKAYQHSLAVRLAEYARRPHPPPLARKQRVEAWFRFVTMLLPGPLRILESMAYGKKSAALSITTPLSPKAWICGNKLTFPASEFRIYSPWFVEDDSASSTTTPSSNNKNNGGDGGGEETGSSTHHFIDEQNAEQERLFLEELNRRWILPKLRARPWFTARSLYIRLVSDIAVLCTFGVLFPPLLLVVAGAMIVDLFVTKMMLARFLRHVQGWLSLLSQEAFTLNQLLSTTSSARPKSVAMASTAASSVANPLMMFNEPELILDHTSEAARYEVVQEALHTYQSILVSLNSSFSLLDRLLWKGLYLVAFVAACFWSLSLFDILGNEVGANRASVVVVLVVTAPLWLYGVGDVLHLLIKRCGGSAMWTWWLAALGLTPAGDATDDEGATSALSAPAGSNRRSVTSSSRSAAGGSDTSTTNPIAVARRPSSQPHPFASPAASYSANDHLYQPRSLRMTPATLSSAAEAFLPQSFGGGVDRNAGIDGILRETMDRGSLFTNDSEIISVPHEETDDGGEDGIRLTMSSAYSGSSPLSKSPQPSVAFDPSK